MTGVIFSDAYQADEGVNSYRGLTWSGLHRRSLGAIRFRSQCNFSVCILV